MLGAFLGPVIIYISSIPSATFCGKTFQIFRAESVPAY